MRLDFQLQLHGEVESDDRDTRLAALVRFNTFKGQIEEIAEAHGVKIVSSADTLRPHQLTQEEMFKAEYARFNTAQPGRTASERSGPTDFVGEIGELKGVEGVTSPATEVEQLESHSPSLGGAERFRSDFSPEQPE